MRISKRFIEQHRGNNDTVTRVNHDENGCIGDSDSAIIRVESGRVSAKCYRCGAFHCYDLDGFVAKRVAKIDDEPNTPMLPKTVSMLWADISTEAKDWLIKGGFTKELYEQHRFSFDDRTNRLFIPAVNSYQRWWAVRHFAKDAKSRYLTRCWHKDATFGYCRADVTQGDVLYLCEDLISMYRLADAGFDALALCTTSISDKALAFLAKMGYTSVRIALDNDNAQVLLARAVIMRRLGWLGDVDVANLETDPKKYTKEQLQEMLRE